MGNLKELARADRFELQILGKLKLEGSSAPAESCLCNTVNISTSGALVETGFMVPKGSLVKYTFTLPGTDRSVEITGEIIRVEPGTEAAPRRIRPTSETPRKILRYGIMFLDLTESDRDAMDEFLTFYKKRNEHQRT
ncbi:MAG: PilZ domain-containing protein [Deltaproteobacteria bacterium]|nr:PilZ domain-containing protein [Deltaproteobacteria bacterium]MBZ0220251.1 PilZ domain-containing protein [Deltaproteobacteria bacterium]